MFLFCKSFVTVPGGQEQAPNESHVFAVSAALNSLSACNLT